MSRKRKRKSSSPRPAAGPPPAEPVPTDAVIAQFEKDVDASLLDRNLKLTVEERLLQLQRVVAAIHELRQAVRSVR